MIKAVAMTHFLIQNYKFTNCPDTIEADGNKLGQKNKSRAVARKLHDVENVFLRPMTLWLLFASAYERSRQL